MKAKANHRQTIWMIVTVVFLVAIPSTIAQTPQWETSGNNIYYNAGTVGIGAQSSGPKLEVSGQSRFNPGASFSAIDTGWAAAFGYSGANWGVRLGATGGQGVIQVAQGSTAYDLALQPYGGNLGIGTTNPGSRLEVSGQSRFNPGASFSAIDTGWAAAFGYSGANWGVRLGATGGQGVIQVAQGSTAYDLALQPYGGKIGIGTTSPEATLHVQGTGKVTGNLTVDGNITAKYQDMAEWVTSSEQLAPGTVVVLDSARSNQVISSSQSYDTRVAGVISAQPGITLGEKGDGKVLVATTGRVKIKVDASKSPIRIGDLLVTRISSGDSGGILIGATASEQPVVEFRVSDDSVRSKVELNSINTASERLGFFIRDGASNWNEGLSIVKPGNVGLGTTTPAYKLQVVAPGGTSGVGISFNSATEQAFQITNTNAGGKTWSLGPGIGGAAGTFGIYNVSDAQLPFSIGPAGALTVQGANAGLSLASQTGAGAAWTIYDSAGTLNYYNGGVDPKVVFNSSGNVGIGTTSPSYNLHVTGSFAWGTAGATRSYAGGATKLFAYADSNSNVHYSGGSGGFGINNAADSERLVQVTDGGNVGIGIFNPGSYKLNVNGTINATGLNINGSPVTSSQWSAGSGNINYTSGNVGIGTASPLALMDLNGHGAAGTLLLRDTTAPPLLQFHNQAGNSGFILKNTGGSGASVLQFTKDTTNVMTLDNSGNVGIGTATPNAGSKLDVRGGVSINQNQSSTQRGAGLDLGWTGNGNADLYFGDHTNGWALGENIDASLRIFKTSGATLSSTPMTIQAGGNVGIGTTSPSYNLHVAGSFAWGTAGATRSYAGGATKLFAYADSNSNVHYSGGSGGFGINNAADSVRLVQVTDGGNVGIGEFAPSEKLEVNGNLKLTGTGNINAAGTIEAGNIKAKYQDVAEWVPSSEQLAPGTVVVLDPTKSNQVIASTVGYDTRVAGVISAQPGITLGEKGEGKVLVATTGRVKIKVDASQSPIRIGDLLVTSDIPGVAMKSEPVELAGRKMHMPGTLIGKALEPWEKGKGEVLVLLSLQ